MLFLDKRIKNLNFAPFPNSLSIHKFVQILLIVESNVSKPLGL